MRVCPALVLLAVLLATLISPAAAQSPSTNCTDYDAWEWAQSELDRVPSLAAGLDPDGNGVACDELPRGGFAPAWWASTIPDSAVPAELVSIVDGDTLVVMIDGVEDEVRTYRSDTPEVDACGGDVATAFAQTALSYNDHDLTIYLESDETERDRYDRRLAYVWFEVAGRPYLLNEVLERSGWARDVDYGDRLYENELAMATQFAERHQIGQYALCGGFDAASLAKDPGTDGTSDIDNGNGGSGQANQQPTAVPQGPGAGSCDPSYPDVCIAPIEVTGDLDCGQITERRFRVVPPDPHGFDAEGDGMGCETG